MGGNGLRGGMIAAGHNGNNVTQVTKDADGRLQQPARPQGKA